MAGRLHSRLNAPGLPRWGKLRASPPRCARCTWMRGKFRSHRPECSPDTRSADPRDACGITRMAPARVPSSTGPTSRNCFACQPRSGSYVVRRFLVTHAPRERATRCSGLAAQPSNRHLRDAREPPPDFPGRRPRRGLRMLRGGNLLGAFSICHTVAGPTTECLPCVEPEMTHPFRLRI